LGFDFRLNEDRIAGAGKFLTKLWNTSRFISSFPQPRSAKLTPTDKWMLSELGKLITECVRSYEEYDTFRVATRLREFLWNVFASHYIEMAKGRAYGDNASVEEQEAAWYTLHEVLRSVLLILAPISPYITEQVWRKIYGTTSIHLEMFPKPMKFAINQKVSQSILEFNTQLWKVKKNKGLALKDPVEAKIPNLLKPYEKDLVRMHHIQS